MSRLTLAQAHEIISTAFEFAAAQRLKPLSIAILDEGGHLKAFQKQDGSSMLRFEIAFGKAFGALAVGMGSRWLEQAAKDRPHFIEGLSAVSGGRIVPVPGGVLLISQEGEMIGAAGVTGDTSDNDEATAVFGIEAAGLKAQPS
jgi:uncharacterized protein GlcG (DUF336 family)